MTLSDRTETNIASTTSTRPRVRVALRNAHASVKELPDATTTSAFVEALGVTLGRRPDPIRLGDEAFVTTNGSVVVSKDNKVLVVDV